MEYVYLVASLPTLGLTTAPPISSAEMLASSAGVLRGRPRGFLQMRMLGLTVTVALAATLLAIGALVVLAVDLFG